jgi:hypothetical protein
MSTLPRIQYNSINVDFDRGVNVFDYGRDQRRVENESANGIIETLSYYERARVAIQRRIASADLQAQLEQFWLYARTGQSFSFWRDRDLAGYWDFEGKSYSSNDGVAGTFARATTAYYTDPTDGLVKTVASGAARFPAGKFGRGLLIESAATNILVRSEEFDNASWIKTNVTVAANTTDTKDPNGGTTADSLTTTSTNGTVAQETSTNIGTNPGVFSVYLKTKQLGSQSATLTIYRVIAGTTLATQAITITSQWQRFSVQYPYAGGGAITDNWAVMITFPDNGEVFYAWGAQFEAGRQFATTYMPTTSAAATRNTDVLTFAASSFFDDEPIYGSIGLWINPSFAYATNQLSHQLLFVDGISSSDLIDLNITSANEVIFIIYDKLGSFASVGISLADYWSSGWLRVDCTWDLTISNGLKVYINGILRNTSSNSSFSPKRIGTNFRIGSNQAGTYFADGIIDEVELRKDVLTAQQISNYYNSGRAFGWRRNYFSSMLIDQASYEPDLIDGGWRFDVPLVFKEVLT